jgi:hypothetical protein
VPSLFSLSTTHCSAFAFTRRYPTISQYTRFISNPNLIPYSDRLLRALGASQIGGRPRHLAAVEHRNVNQYMLNLLERNLAIEEKHASEFGDWFSRLARDLNANGVQIKTKTTRTAIHFRCSIQEADRIRQAAARRKMSISNFAVFALHRSWRASDRVRIPFSIHRSF